MIDGRGKAKRRTNTTPLTKCLADRPMKRVTTFEYKPFQTPTTNDATGAVTVQYLDERWPGRVLVTHGYGTASATTETLPTTQLATSLSRHRRERPHDEIHLRRRAQPHEHGRPRPNTKRNGRITRRTTSKRKRQPDGETTTYKRDSHGNPEVIERPAPGSKTQTTKYKYDAHGEVESMEDPLKRVLEIRIRHRGRQDGRNRPGRRQADLGL